MKPVIIIAIAVILLLIPISAYADVKISGTTISGSSDGDIVQISISNSDGKKVWEKSVSVDETFEITMPRLEHGKYTLSMKHGAIGGDQEVIEFTYTGPLPIGNFELIINLPTEDGADRDEFEKKNYEVNILKLKDFVHDSDRPIRLLEVIELQMAEGQGNAREELSDTTHYTPDGVETLGYLKFSIEDQAYSIMYSRINHVLRLIEGGMSLETAFASILNDIEQRGTLPEDPIDELTAKIDELVAQITHLTLQINELKEENEKLQKQLEANTYKTVRKEIASFVDRNKDPQSYIDKYNNEEGYKEWFHENNPDYKSIHEAVGKREPVPNWIKTNAQWWSEGKISDDEFVSGIEYLVKQKIIDVDEEDDDPFSNRGDEEDWQ